MVHQVGARHTKYSRHALRRPEAARCASRRVLHRMLCVACCAFNQKLVARWLALLCFALLEDRAQAGRMLLRTLTEHAPVGHPIANESAPQPWA